MGADKKFSTKKCGEILLKLNTNKKAKVYTFNCAFCDENYDQMKKFSLHLDEKHSENLTGEFTWTLQQSLALGVEKENELKNEHLKEELTTAEDFKQDVEMLVPEIKITELMEIGGEKVPTDEIVTRGFADNVGEDPLMMKVTLEKSTVTKMEVNVKQETDLYDSDEGGNADDFNCEDDSDYNESEIESECDSSDEDDKLLIEIKNEHKSDKSSSLGKKLTIDDQNKSRSKRRKRKLNVDEKLLLSTILHSLEKQPVLWDVKCRERKKAVLQNAYEAITKEVNETLDIKIKWEDVRKHIQDVRNTYSSEVEKQRKGEEFEIPWYAENIKFLTENIDVLLKNRQFRKYQRLKRLDESHIPVLIEYYKNCEILWQVKNIAFVVKSKRIEALSAIIEDFKENHNIDVTAEGMQTRFNFLNRIYSTDRERELKCEADKIEFVPTSKYYKELSFLRHSQGPFKCPHCDEVIKRLEAYQIHLGEHTNNRPFKCHVCGSDFGKYKIYVIHAKRHLGVYNYNCDICGKGYPVRAELDRHYREHTSEEPYLCEICGASFRSRNGHDNHVRRHEKRFRYECHICKQGFNHLHILKTHLKVHLNIRDILCNICGKGFTAKRHLRHHQLIHSDEKKYKCLTCGKAFSQHSGLRAHRKQHPSCQASVA